MPKTLTGEELQLDDGPVKGAELFLVDGNNLAYRAYFALPEELQTTDGQPTNALLGFTNMLFKLLSDYSPRGVAVAWDTRPTHRTEIARDVQGRPPPDAGSAPRAVPALPADRRGVRLLEPRVRGVGGRRRDRDARDARGRRGDPHVRRLDRPRRVPALQRERLADDDAAGRRGRARLHARAGRAPVRRPSRPGAGLHRAQGRHVGQHPGDPRDRRQDRRPADRAVRLARGRDRARRRALARPLEGRHRARRPGARVEGARDDAPRPAARGRRRRARRVTAGPLDAQGDLPPLRVPRAARPRRHARRGAAGGRAAVEADQVDVPWREGALEPQSGAIGIAASDGRVAVATDADVVVAAADRAEIGARPRNGRGRDARREGAAPRSCLPTTR